MVGFEVEACLVDRNFFPVPENEAFLEKLSHPFVVPELSRFNIELNGTPQPATGRGLSRLEAELEATWRRCLEVGHTVDTSLIMIGILPTLRNRDLTLANISPRNRYYALNEQVLRQRAGRPLRLQVTGRDHLELLHSDVMLEAAATSFQVHLQVPASEAHRYYNASLILSGPLTALAANSPFLFGKSLWEETRIPLFEQAVDTGNADAPELRRVTFGSGYIESPLACFRENLDCYPVLLPTEFPDGASRLRHLRLHNGTIWRWNRILVGFDAAGGPALRIEHRVMPSGPTIGDMIANAAVYIGAARFLAGLRDAPEADIPFATARDNFYRAARDGLDARIMWLGGSELTARELLADELLHMAREGLVLLGIDRDDAHRYLDLIRARVHVGQNGARWQRDFVTQHGEDFFRLTAEYLAGQRSGIPVHEWPI
jgi:gamma-glutamyl:cysteine ligase YbdK (ATP-grasp superfamily)